MSAGTPPEAINSHDVGVVQAACDALVVAVLGAQLPRLELGCASA
jgi:hypothetical protein